MKKFTKRSTAPEIMDTFEEDGQLLQKVFGDINKANSLLGGTSITLNAVDALVSKVPKPHYTIVDMGCGDGSLLRLLARKYRAEASDFSFIGVDQNKLALQLAQEKSMAYPEISFVRGDILDIKPQEWNCDILMCNLTMHHFDDNQIKDFVSQFIELSDIGVVINDLERSVLAYYLFKLFSSIFIKTKIAKQDGLVSIKRGFTKKELEYLSLSYPKVNHTIKWKWAFRYLWVMELDQKTTS